MKSIISQLASQWQLFSVIAALAFVAGLYSAHQVTSFYYTAKINEDKALSQGAVIEAQQKAAVLIAHRETLSNEVSGDYEKRITDLQRRYAAELDSLRTQYDATGDRESLPGVSPPTCKCHEGTRTNRLSQRDKERLLRLAQQADEQTQRLIACQNWARSQKSLTNTAPQ